MRFPKWRASLAWLLELFNLINCSLTSFLLLSLLQLVYSPPHRTSTHFSDIQTTANLTAEPDTPLPLWCWNRLTSHALDYLLSPNDQFIDIWLENANKSTISQSMSKFSNYFNASKRLPTFNAFYRLPMTPQLLPNGFQQLPTAFKRLAWPFTALASNS